MNKKIQITAIFMALAIFGLCALIAPVCADSGVTNAEDAIDGGEGNASNESATDVSIAAINATDIETINATDIETTSTDTDPEATSTEEASPGFGILGVMISVALLFLLIRKKA